MVDQKSTALAAAQHNTPSFLADATSSLEKMEAYANLLIKSGLVPKHFYELDNYRNPIKGADGQFKGNTAAVIMTIQHGLELGMSITQSLQQIVPVNGLMSLRGDAAKALIMRSNLCKEWVEEEVGTQGTDSFGIKITSKRIDGQTISRSFTVLDAKRAALWITDAMVASKDSLKHSPWYKYQSRMLRYRALGFISRDLYGDVLQNMYTEDEARDIGEDNTSFVTQDGITARIDEAKPEKLNKDAKDALSTPTTAHKPRKTAAPKAEKVAPVIEDAVLVEDAPPAEPVKGEVRIEYTKGQLDEKTASEMLALVNDTLGINVDDKLFSGDNKSKRLVGYLKKIILCHQDGTLDEYLKTEFKTSMAELRGEDVAGDIEDTEELTAPEAETASAYEIPEPGESGRVFGEKMALDKKREDAGITREAIMSFIKDRGLGYESIEAFYQNAPSETILIAFGLQ